MVYLSPALVRNLTSTKCLLIVARYFPDRWLFEGSNRFREAGNAVVQSVKVMHENVAYAAREHRPAFPSLFRVIYLEIIRKIPPFKHIGSHHELSVADIYRMEFPMLNTDSTLLVY